jgi:hypothetical protein
MVMGFFCFDAYTKKTVYLKFIPPLFGDCITSPFMVRQAHHARIAAL